MVPWVRCDRHSRKNGAECNRCWRRVAPGYPRYGLHESVVQKAACGRAEHCHPEASDRRTFQYFFATHLLEDGYAIRPVQELLGDKDMRTTRIYTHVLNHAPVAPLFAHSHAFCAKLVTRTPCCCGWRA